MGFMDIIDTLNGFVWGTPLIVLLLGTGAIITIGSGFFQFAHFGWIMKNTFGSMTKKNSEGEGTISAFEAASIAVGGAVGAGNIGGVATAIAAGGLLMMEIMRRAGNDLRVFDWYIASPQKNPLLRPKTLSPFRIYSTIP